MVCITRGSGHAFIGNGTTRVEAGWVTYVPRGTRHGFINEDVSALEYASGGISLSAAGYKVRGIRHADLTWSGASGSVNIYRDGGIIGSGRAAGSYTDTIGNGSGTITCMVCLTSNVNVCSNHAVVTF